MDIFSIGDAAFLEQVISAVTLISGAGEFATMAKIAFLFGVILVVFQAIISGGRAINTTQIGMAGLVYALMFGGTQTVTITDAYTQEVRVVDNVPNGVAVPGSFLSSIGFNLTELFETAFSTPTMTAQGYGFSLDVLKRIRLNSLSVFHLGEANAATPGADFYRSWEDYIMRCTLPAIENGQIQRDDIFRAPDFLAALRYESSLNMAEIRIGGAPRTLECDDAHAELAAFTTAVFLPSFKQNILPGVLDLDPFAGAAEVEETVADALNGLGIGPASLPIGGPIQAPPVTADQFITSSVLVPIYYQAVHQRYSEDHKFNYAAQIDDAIRARNSQWLANQSLFDRYLRPLLTCLEGFMFAATPLLALLVPVGMIGIRTAGRFILIVAWIQLWLPSLAIVNLFLHDVVAGKLTALANAGTPLTSMAGLFHGDDVILTWLATGGLMASAVPPLTLMLVYGGAISANFFATRLQGEDVVMERQAAPASFNPWEQTHIDPLRTYNPAVGAAMQTGGSARLATFSYSRDEAEMRESAFEARHQEMLQFQEALRNGLHAGWSDETRASLGHGFNQKILAEGGQAESFVDQNLGAVMSELSAQTGLSTADITNYVASTYGGLSGALGARSKSGATSGSANAGGNLSVDDRETSTNSSDRHERLGILLDERIGDEIRFSAGLTEAMASDIHGDTSDALISSETFAHDESVSKEAAELLSASQSYQESARASVAMGATRQLSGDMAASLVAGSYEASTHLGNVIAAEGLGRAVEHYKTVHGERDLETFGGSAELANTYAQLVTLQGMTTSAGITGPNAERAQAFLGDILATADGVGGSIGGAYDNQAMAGGLPLSGGVSGRVESGFAGPLAGATAIQSGIEARQDLIEGQVDQIPSTHSQHTGNVADARREGLSEHNERSQAAQTRQRALVDRVDLDGPLGTLEKGYEGLKQGVEDAKDWLSSK